MPVGPTNPTLGQPDPTLIPGPPSPNTPYPVVEPAEYNPPAYAAGTEVQSGVAAATVNAGNQTTPGVPGPQGGFQLVGSTTGASRTDMPYKTSNPAVIIISPSPFAFTTPNQIQTFTAVVKDGRGKILPKATVTWSSQTSAITIDPISGVAQAIATGANGYLILATVVGFPLVTNTVSVSTPAPIISTFSVSPTTLNLPNGTPVQLTTTAADQWGAPVAANGVVWTSTQPTLISVSSSGLVTGLVGSSAATVSGAVSGLNATCNVTTGAPVLAGVTPIPLNATIATGTQSYTASEVDQFGQPVGGGGGPGGVAVLAAGKYGSTGAQIASVQAATSLWIKGRVLADMIINMTAAGACDLFGIDSDGAGTNKKVAMSVEASTINAFILRYSAQGLVCIRHSRSPPEYANRRDICGVLLCV